MAQSLLVITGVIMGGLLRVRSTKRAHVTFLALFLLLGGVIRDATAGKLNDRLKERALRTPLETVSALVFLTADPDESISLSASVNKEKSFAERYRTAYAGLRVAARHSFDSFVAEAAKGGLRPVLGRTFWIANAVEVTASLGELDKLADLKSVEIVVEDTVLELVTPIEVSASSSPSGGVEPNLLAINAHTLWAMGLTGAGRLVMSFDTGVDGGHAGLSSRWRGLTSGNPSSAWYDPFETDFPQDNVGHGTHVMGIMAGVYDGDTLGVAPDVEWACAAVVDRGTGFSQTISDILAAFEWAADPDGTPETVDDIPDAICHSWGVPKGVFGPCDNTFWQAIDNLEQLGIVNVFACGNEGPDSATIRNPADRASSPLNSFSIGAIDQRDTSYPVANFSSRGPANCDSTQMKPEVVAPGVSIRSLYPGNSTKIMSGTSMASPHVAGAVALLRQYNPDATVEQIKHALMMSARDIGEPGEDNASGFGVIDLERALDYLPMPQHALIQFRGFEISDGGNHIIEPEEIVQLMVEVDVRNFDVAGLWGVLQTYDSGITIISDSAFFGSLATGGHSGNDSQPFEIQASRLITPGSSVIFRIDFYDEPGNFLNNVYFNVIAAQSQDAASGSISNGPASVGSCNYGIVGLGTRSMVNMGQAGFSVESVDYLAEFALAVIDSAGRVSDAARDATGDVSDNDFVASPGPSFVMGSSDSWGDLELIGRFTDGLAEDPIGIEVEQRVSLFYGQDLSTTAFVHYLIRNIDPNVSRTLSAGVVVDVDFPDGGLEMLGYDASRNLVYYYNTELDRYVGMGILDGPVHSLVICSNPFDSKLGLSDLTKRNLLLSGQISNLPSKRGDYANIVSTVPTGVSDGEFLEFGIAMIWAGSESELFSKFDQAYGTYHAPSAADESDVNVPREFSLSQNYPNPFNPQTTIAFSIGQEQHVTLAVYNVLGQRVKTLVDQALGIGNHQFVWSGSDDFGNSVASGVYFYRLEASGKSLTRKMLLIK